MVANPEQTKSRTWDNYIASLGGHSSKHKRNPINQAKCIAKRRVRNRIAGASRRKNRI
jgi:hypothetical protein